MSLGESKGGLPPDSVVEDEDAILAHTEDDPPLSRSGARFDVPVVVAPCSPFSVTPQLMRDSAELARRHGVRLHTHLAETLDEERFCLDRFGKRPLELMQDLGWTGDDVWFAHGIHLNDGEIGQVAKSQTGIAHCPSSNMRLVRECAESKTWFAPAPGWPGRRRRGEQRGRESRDGDSRGGVHRARESGDARARGRGHRAGRSRGVEAGDGRRRRLPGTRRLRRARGGKCADIAFFRLDDLATRDGGSACRAGAGPTARAEAVVVNGKIVVREGRLLTGDQERITRDIAAESKRLAARGHSL